MPPSPPPQAKQKSPELDSDSRPPAKRARKAINCEPCRASKLKCDKARPCSSCVLRGTASQCYMNGKDDQDYRVRNGIDPHNEIARIRQSVASLEAYILRGANATSRSSGTNSSVRSSVVKQEPEDTLPDSAAPGMLAERAKGGFYTGPTSTATLLFSLRAASDTRETDESDRTDSDPEDVPLDIARGFDDDLLAQLPAIHIIDGLVDYYFEYCNWMYRHVNQSAFLTSWGKFKESASADRLVLATLSVVMAVAVRYLPENHALISSLSQTRIELGEKYYEVAKEALSRYRSESRSVSLELVELLLIRTHYLTLSKNESEDIWAIRGELVSIGTAMGLHRDPDKWRMPRELAERRRWAWWHIILLERWQCFLFGRPLSIAVHHYDTRMPSYVDPAIDPTGRLYQPNIALFRLAHILGDIVDDAVSIRPVPYERVLDLDRALVKWSEELPKELDLDEYRLARALASPIPSDLRLAVQSVLIRTSYYHIRFTLHRPYAAAAHDHPSDSTRAGNSSPVSGGGSKSDSSHASHERTSQSLDTAASAADKLIQLVGQSRPDLLANSALAATHVHWGPFHCFSAAMFFSFQLIANPDQPGASLFRANIRRVLDILAQARGVAIADKATDILLALAPLYETKTNDLVSDREKTKRNVLSLVKNLAFPYHDSHSQSKSGHDSPISSSLNSPYRKNSINSVPSPPSTSSSATVAMATQMISPITARSPSYMHPAPPYSRTPSQISTPRDPTLGLLTSASQLSASSIDTNPYFTQVGHPPQYNSMPPSIAASPTVPFQQGAEDISMWGASVGFGQGEWTRFLDVMQRPETSALAV